MNIFQRMIGGLATMAGFTVDPQSIRDPALAKTFGLGMGTDAGVTVDHENVMALPAVVRAVNIISNGVAKTPFYVFKTEGKSKTWDMEHPSWDVVTRKPCTDITDDAFRQTMTAWAMLYGNAVAYIRRPNWPQSGEGMELIPLMPHRTTLVRISRGMVQRYPLIEDRLGKLYIQTWIDNKLRTFAYSECFHIRGLGMNPYWGIDVVECLREAFGGVMASQEFGHRFYGKGANPAGFIEMPAGLDEEAEENFVESIRRGSEGMGKAHRFMLLEEGAKFHQWTIDPDKAQFLEGKQFDVRTIAMILGVKVHKLIDSANTSFSSLESANQEHRDDDLVPWLNRWKKQMSDKLLTTSQQRTMSHSIDVDDESLHWAPFAERAEGVVKLYHGGLIDKDEGRRRVNFGPAESEYSARFLKPLNHEWEDAPTVQRPQSGPPPSEPQPDPEPDAEPETESGPGDTRFEQVAEAYLDRIAKRLAKTATAKTAKGGAIVCEWVDLLRPESGPEVIQPQIDSLFGDFAAVVNATLDVTAEADLETAMASAVTRWLETRTEMETAA